MSHVIRLLLTVALALPLLCACAAPALLGNPRQPYPPEQAPQIGDILHLRTGIPVNEAQMLTAATDARIVYVGETHDNPASHRLQLTVLKALAQRYPQRTVLAMEMFTPAQQAVLDDWLNGTLDDKGFLRHWYKGWGMNFDYYRDLLVFARANQIPVLAINAEKSLVRAVGRQDFTALPPEEQAQLPRDIDQHDPYQTAMSRAIFGDHDHGNGQLAGFQRIQTLWDETMAENIARYLERPGVEDVHMLVVAGGNHIRYGFGIPRRVFRRAPLSYVLIGSEELEVSEAKKKEVYMNVTLPPFPMPAWDYLVYTRYEELDRSGEVKLGVSLKGDVGKVWVIDVAPGSVGEQGGVKNGDRLLRFDQEPLNEPFDLIYAVKQKQPGDTARLLVERDGQQLELMIRFALPPASAPQH